jgi:hypothetical protein
MNNFEQVMSDTIQKSILKGISETKFFDYWHKDKLGIPADIVKEAYATIDREKILRVVRESIEEQIAKTIIGQLLTETANDTKKIMSDPELRQQIRNKVYPQIMQLIE